MRTVEEEDREKFSNDKLNQAISKWPTRHIEWQGSASQPDGTRCRQGGSEGGKVDNENLNANNGSTTLRAKPRSQLGEHLRMQVLRQLYIRCLFDGTLRLQALRAQKLSRHSSMVMAACAAMSRIRRNQPR